MADRFDFLENIGTKKGHWKVQVYVIRVWKEMHKYKINEVNSIEMVLQDVKGGSIQASIPKCLFSRHGSSVEEFKMYVMTTFIVQEKKDMPRTTESKWTLTFSNRTTVDAVLEPAFPLERFRFRNISELLTADPIDCSHLFDVIAEVVGKEEPRDITTVAGRPTKRLALKIQDLDLVDQIQPHMDEERVEPLIVVFNYLELTDGKTSVQSHYTTSKLQINPSLPEVIEFRTRLLSDQPSGFVRIASVSSQSGSASINDLRRGTEKVKSIEKVMNSEEAGQLWIAGRIMSINAGLKDWYYPAHLRQKG
ncbi:hypothetical protein PIB30_084776 [Stylosanthes scabra]|uniref:Replication protein A 70 kDa DNA-binding subunit B/D first OB fold domain-containing protein n=1 Tax=Stylosanthes scabra TaxID=79078 RepID=A0ABU6XQW2_9FABA|nr:hypothetical protein [Stylosanthes scabra]